MRNQSIVAAACLLVAIPSHAVELECTFSRSDNNVVTHRFNIDTEKGLLSFAGKSQTVMVTTTTTEYSFVAKDWGSIEPKHNDYCQGSFGVGISRSTGEFTVSGSFGCGNYGSIQMCKPVTVAKM